MKDYYVASSTLPIGDTGGPEARGGTPPSTRRTARQRGHRRLHRGFRLRRGPEEGLRVKDLTREGVDKALLTIKAFGDDFGISHDFTDPSAPSTRQTVILQPDKSVTGGMKVVRDPEASDTATAYTPAT